MKTFNCTAENNYLLHYLITPLFFVAPFIDVERKLIHKIKKIHIRKLFNRLMSRNRRLSADMMNLFVS